jgi:hypothetical protein
MFGAGRVLQVNLKKKTKTQTKELSRAKARNFKQKFYIHYSRNQQIIQCLS